MGPVGSAGPENGCENEYHSGDGYQSPGNFGAGVPKISSPRANVFGAG